MYLTMDTPYVQFEEINLKFCDDEETTTCVRNVLCGDEIISDEQPKSLKEKNFLEFYETYKNLNIKIMIKSNTHTIFGEVDWILTKPFVLYMKNRKDGFGDYPRHLHKLTIMSYV